MSKANDRQVGGTHYDAEYKHWDWVVDIAMQYHEGCATKHVARYDKKGEPIEDLEKALHYIEKAIEEAPLIQARVRQIRPSSYFIVEATERFCEANNIVDDAEKVMFRLSNWNTVGNLKHASALVRRLLSVEQAKLPRNDAKPVPLEDSNKHALQEQDE